MDYEFENDVKEQIMSWYQKMLREGGRWEWSEDDHFNHLNDVRNNDPLFKRVAISYWKEYFKEK